MVRRAPVFVLLLILLPLCTGCHVRTDTSGKDTAEPILEYASLPTVKYARGFRFEKDAGSTVLIFSDPLNPGKEIARYRLVPAGTSLNKTEGIMDIGVPVSHIAASSTTHAGFLSSIGAGESLMGCNNPERLYDTLLFNRFQRGQLVRTGRDQGYNLEYLL